MDIPSGATLHREYRRFVRDSQICQRKRPRTAAEIAERDAGYATPADAAAAERNLYLVKEQCAVRMSVALGRVNCGFNLTTWQSRDHVHTTGGNSACRELPDHVTSSSNLIQHLMRELDLSFEIFDTGGPLVNQNLHRLGLSRSAITQQLTKPDIFEAIKRKMGIIYFGKSGRTRVNISHIDFWNQGYSMNRVLANSDGSDTPRGYEFLPHTRGLILFAETP